MVYKREGIRQHEQEQILLELLKYLFKGTADGIKNALLNKSKIIWQQNQKN